MSGLVQEWEKCVHQLKRGMVIEDLVCCVEVTADLVNDAWIGSVDGLRGARSRNREKRLHW